VCAVDGDHNAVRNTSALGFRSPLPFVSNGIKLGKDCHCEEPFGFAALLRNRMLVP